MIKTLLLFGLFCASLFSHGCKSAAATDDLKTQKEQPIVQEKTNGLPNALNTPPKIEKSKTDSQTVNFKGVSFDYNSQIFDKVETEDVEESPLRQKTDKPDSVSPKHTAFRLKYKKSEREATISIFPIEDYRRMYAVSKDMTESFDGNIKNLQKALKDEKFRLDGEIPVVPYYDAHQVITARVKHLSFQNGAGIFFLTQFNQDFANLVNNDELTYFYQGISADGKKYVLAEFPASAAFLPKDNQVNEFEGYKLPLTYDELNEKAHQEYIAKITKRLENLPPEKFQPNLKYIDEIISTLKIE